MSYLLYSIPYAYRTCHMPCPSGVQPQNPVWKDYLNYKRKGLDMFVTLNITPTPVLYSKKKKILVIDDLFKIHCAKIVYKKLQKKLHHYHSGKLIMEFEEQLITTRQKFDIQISTPGNKFTRMNSLCHRIGASWNRLPYELKISAFKTMPTFVKHLKRSYLDSYPEACTITNCFSCKWYCCVSS